MLGARSGESNAVRLASGSMIQTIGLGTWLSDKKDVGLAVKEAVQCGYRHFDCASIYENEKEVGNAFKQCIDEGIVKRNELFITSKLWNTDHSAKNVLRACLQSIEDLQCRYLDLYLIHWPLAMRTNKFTPPIDIDFVPLVETWQAMEGLVDSGLVKNIGVCNFNCAILLELLCICHIKPAVLQIENNAYLPQNELVTFAKSQGIVVTSYSPLGHPNFPKELSGDVHMPILLNDHRIIDIAKRINKTPAQVLLRYNIQRGLVVIPKSTNKNHLIENFNVFDFQLNSDDMNKINDIHKTTCVRTLDPYVMWAVPLFKK
jgi:aldehyde reductase